MLVDAGDHWLGMTAAFRILTVIVDRFIYYGLIAVSWKSWRSARAGFSRNESRSVLSLIIFTGASDLIWLATDAEGQSAMPTVIFRTAFWLYLCLGCRFQGRKIQARLEVVEKTLGADGNLSSVAQTEMEGKAERLKRHVRAHQLLWWFGLAFGVYSVAYVIAVSQQMLPAVLTAVLWEELAYTLVYLFLCTLVLKDFIH